MSNILPDHLETKLLELKVRLLERRVNGEISQEEYEQLLGEIGQFSYPVNLDGTVYCGDEEHTSISASGEEPVTKPIRILKAIAWSLRKDPADILPEDYSNVTKLVPTLLDYQSDISLISRCKNLKILKIRNCRALTDISPLAKLTKLETLELINCEQLKDVSPLVNLKKLRELTMNGSELFVDLEIPKLPLLTTLDLSGSSSLRQITFQDLPEINSIDLSNCYTLNNLDIFASLDSLANLNLHSCKSIQDLTPLLSCPSLTEVIASYTKTSKTDKEKLKAHLNSNRKRKKRR